MGSNEGGSMPTAASIGEFIRSWRLKESVCLVSLWGLGKLALSAYSVYDQYVPPAIPFFAIGIYFFGQKHMSFLSAIPQLLSDHFYCCHRASAELSPEPSRLLAHLIYQQSEPAHYLWIASMTVLENNEDGVNGYPVLLESEWCLAENFSSCNSTSSDTECCQEMEAGVQPGETVSTRMLFIISVVVPFAFIVLRQISIGYGLWTGGGTFADLFLGFVFSLTTCSLLTEIIKVLVGRPRPIYFAMQALIEYGGSDVYFLDALSTTSFPSGHSSSSMAGMFFVTLICWADLLYSAGSYTGRTRVILAYLAVLPALVSVWVGVTRIRDFWHFQDDVLAGWTIGALAAAMAVRWITFPETFSRRSAMVDDHLGEDLKINLLSGTQTNGSAFMDSAYGSAGYNARNEVQVPISFA